MGHKKLTVNILRSQNEFTTRHHLPNNLKNQNMISKRIRQTPNDSKTSNQTSSFDSVLPLTITVSVTRKNTSSLTVNLEKRNSKESTSSESLARTPDVLQQGFLANRRNVKRSRVLSNDLPKIPIVAPPPVANQVFGWDDFPQSSRHVSPVDTHHES